MAVEDERKVVRAAAEGAVEREVVRDVARPGPEPREPRDTRLPLERLAAEFLKRGLSAGRDVSESFFPKELATNIAAQLVDARHGLVNAIAGEVGRFLRQADIASEIRKVLAGLNVEAKLQIRFSEDEQGKLRTRTEIESASAGGRKTPKPPTPDER
ncbi:MAG TPA: hypothetical protein VF331_27940 [Polyangiales bacterium]